MLKRIKKYFNIIQENENLKARAEYWEKKANELANKSTPELVIERLLERGIGWYDYKSLEMSEQRTYHGDVQVILSTKAFKNEINHYMSDIVQEIAKTSRSFEDIMQMRMLITSMLAFRERLESIENPDKPKPKVTNPHSVM